MSQQKAASLTSNLFARKGKASPASLLISELEAGGAETPVAATSHGTANGRSGANGSRRKPKPVEDLPLLAFVEAQGADATTAAAEAAPPVDEPAPAASLLERGARSWRRANGHAAVPEPAPAAVEQPEAAVGARLPEDAGDVLPDDAGEQRTISGDANVAAIEDAPQEEPSQEAAPQQDRHTPVAAEEEAAAAAQDGGFAAATEPAGEPPAPAPAATAAATATATAPEPPAPAGGGQSLSAMPATLALRKAA